MADPISIAASIIAVSGAATAVAKGARSFYRIATKAGSATQDAEFFASNIETFGSTLSLVHSTIREHYLKYQKSQVLESLSQHATLKELAFQSGYLMQRVKKLQPQVKANETSLNFKARWQWLWQSSEREELSIKMERVKMSFMMAMLQVVYEALQQQASNHASFPEELFDFKREIRNHKRLMRTHMKTMGLWKDRQDNFTRNIFQHPEEDHDIGFNTAEAVLLDLGERIVTGRASTTSSIPSPINTSILTHEDTHEEFQHNSAHRHVAPSENSSLYPGRLRLSPETLQFALNQRAIPLETEEEDTLQSQETAGPSTQRPVEPHWNDGDYIGVEPFDNLVLFDPSLNSEAISGYINDAPAIAILNREFPQNVISQAHAVQLGLYTEDHDAEEDVMQIDFGSGRPELTRGKVTFIWKKGLSPHLPLLRVTCLVCDHAPSPLIFGQLFLKRVQYYWPPSSLGNAGVIWKTH